MNTRCSCGARDWEFLGRERGARCRACGGHLHDVATASHSIGCLCGGCVDVEHPTEAAEGARDSLEIADALEELRDLTEDPTARVVRVYPVWFLSARSTRLADAGGTGQVHCHVETKAGPAYLRASLGRGGLVELDEHGAAETAAPYLRAASALVAPGVRLLLVPARQVTAFWDPSADLLVVVASAATPSILSVDHAIGGAAFEATLAQIELHWLFQRLFGVTP